MIGLLCTLLVWIVRVIVAVVALVFIAGAVMLLVIEFREPADGESNG